MNRPDGRLAARLRTAATALRVSRFELKIAFALVVAATLPLVGALFLAGRVAEENLSLGLDPRVVERLAAVPSLYGELFLARKQLYAEQAREVARALPRDPARAPAALQAAVLRTPRLRRCAWIDPENRTLAEAEKPPSPAARTAIPTTSAPKART